MLTAFCQFFFKTGAVPCAALSALSSGSVCARSRSSVRQKAGRQAGFQRFLGLLAACLLVLTVACPVQAGDGEAARQCLREVGQAIDAADAVAFEQLVDVDAVLDQGLSLFLQEVQKPEVANELPPMLALLFSDAAVRDSPVRSVLHNETRAFVINGVASGAFAGRAPSGAAAQGMLAPLFAEASKGRKEICQIGTARPYKEQWIVPFVVRDGGNDREYAVQGRVGFVPCADGTSRWRLLAVENMRELLLQIQAESRAM